MFYSNVDHIFGIGGEECLKIKSRKKKREFIQTLWNNSSLKPIGYEYEYMETIQRAQAYVNTNSIVQPLIPIISFTSKQTIQRMHTCDIVS